ncbi:MAG: hypothetical protein IJA11_08565 [Oscillospiraceae bacterium]|nr:hypothetical protein [Oscillospiraceae bacterium]
MKYLVSYDLNKPGKNYNDVYEAIKAASDGTWCKPLESVWIIRSALSVNAVYDLIFPHLDANDRLLVIEVTNNSYWYLDKDVSDYLVKML